jgi:hypothetical protein
MGAERATVVLDAGKRLGQPIDLDSLAVGQRVECVLPTDKAAVSGGQPLPMACTAESSPSETPSLP